MSIVFMFSIAVIVRLEMVVEEHVTAPPAVAYKRRGICRARDRRRCPVKAVTTYAYVPP